MYHPITKNRYKLQNIIMLMILLWFLVGCGNNIKQPLKLDASTTANATSNKDLNISVDAKDLAKSIEESHKGHEHHGLKSLIARMNTNAVIENDKAALSETPRKTGSISFAQSLQPLFTGSSRVGMKLLIISASGNPTTADSSDPVLDGIRYFAQEIGIPHDVLIATTETLTEDKLVAANGDGKYQGIIVTETGLLFNNNGSFESAFSDAEWNLLWQYEREFDVRHLAMSGFPGTFPEDYGLRNVDQSGDPLTAKLTTDGAAIFSSLKSGINMPIKNAFTYHARRCSGLDCPTVDTKPILTDAATGNVLGALTKTADGRQVINLTMNHNSF